MKLALNKNLLILFFSITILGFFYGTVFAWTEADIPVEIKYLKTIGGPQTGQFFSPNFVTVDKNNNVYVQDQGYHRIDVYDSNWTFIKSIGEGGTEQGQIGLGSIGIFVDTDGNVYVADTSNNRIDKFNSQGVSVLSFGTEGAADGQFEWPTSVVVDSLGNIFVTEYEGHRIQKFNSSGVFQENIGSNGNGDGQFQKILRGITIDASDKLYVPDSTNNRIVVFDNNGNYLWKFGSDLGSDGGGSLKNPTYVALDNAGNIFVESHGHIAGNIQKFDSSGHFLDVFFGDWDGAYFTPFAIDTNNKLYVSNNDTNIQVYNTSGVLQTTHQPSSLFNVPKGLTYDSAGNIYVVDNQNYRIVKFNSNGDFVMQFGEQGESDNQFSYPIALAVDNNGFIYVVDYYKHAVKKFSSDGQYLQKFGSVGTGSNNFIYPSDIKFDSATGDLFVSDTQNNRIKILSTSGTFIKSISLHNCTDAGSIGFVFNFAVDSSSNIYISDANNLCIQKYSFQGDFVKKYDISGTYGIAIDPVGNIFVNDGAYTIKKFTNEGVPLMQFGTSGYVPGKFSSINYMSIDSNNKLYIADEGDNNIQIYLPDRTPPIGQVQINDGAPQTTAPAVVLDLTAYDDLSSVTQMAISQDPSFNNPAWTNYAQTANLTLSGGNGEKTVYVKYKDAFGNISSTARASIVLSAYTYRGANNPPTNVDEATNPITTLTDNAQPTITPTPKQENLTILPKTGMIQLLILDLNDKPIVSTEILIDGKTFKTDSTGKVDISNLSKGNHKVSIQINGQTYNQAFILGAQSSDLVTIKISYSGYNLLIIIIPVIIIFFLIILILIYKKKYFFSHTPKKL